MILKSFQPGITGGSWQVGDLKDANVWMFSMESMDCKKKQRKHFSISFLFTTLFHQQISWKFKKSTRFSSGVSSRLGQFFQFFSMQPERLLNRIDFRIWGWDIMVSIVYCVLESQWYHPMRIPKLWRLVMAHHEAHHERPAPVRDVWPNHTLTCWKWMKILKKKYQAGILLVRCFDLARREKCKKKLMKNRFLAKRCQDCHVQI